MEEDIKILEKMIKEVKQESISYDKYCYEISVEQVDAIINVLHELKYNKIQFETQLREKLDLQASTIPISVIENKIEEYAKKIEEYEENMGNDIMGFWHKEFLKACHKHQALTELLKESKK